MNLAAQLIGRVTDLRVSQPDLLMRLYKERSQISNQYDQAEAEAVSRSAARRAYTTCASSEGYRAVYDQY